MSPRPKNATTTELDIAYLEYGADDGWPVVLSHGFPYDVHGYEAVARRLEQAGARVIVPYTRGFGPTRFLSPDTMRSGQQAARARDIVELADALGLERPILGGYDWGGNASCVVAALWPERIGGLVSYASYDIIDVNAQRQPAPPSLERVCWYQHLFQSERGREGLAENRRDLCRILWKEWSPEWAFDDQTYDRSAAAFDNPDFVDVVIHAYRCMLGLDDGDPRLRDLEDTLATKPPIIVTTVTLDGTSDPLKPGGTADHSPLFTGRHEHRTFRSGHNFPQESPEAFADAVLTVRHWS
jgi:pimeloyl-ACP methyl ester carboxylesterase